MHTNQFENYGGRLPNNPTSKQQAQKRQPTAKPLDFIAPSNAVKDLFAIPYNNDVGVSVAVHNIGNGTLLLDSFDGGVFPSDDINDLKYAMNNTKTSDGRQSKDAMQKESSHESSDDLVSFRHTSDALLPSISGSSIADSPDLQWKDEISSILKHHNSKQMMSNYTNSHSISKLQSESLTPHAVNNTIEVKSVRVESKMLQKIKSKDGVVEKGSKDSPDAMIMTCPASPLSACSKISVAPSNWTLQNSPSNYNDSSLSYSTGDHDKLMHMLPKPEDYTHRIVTTPKPPREFLRWRFQGYNLLIGSDAFILRIDNDAKEKNATSASMQVNVERSFNNHSILPQEKGLHIERDQVSIFPEASFPKATAQPHRQQNVRQKQGISQALTLRLADLELRNSLRAHEEMVRSEGYMSNNRHNYLCQGKDKQDYASYADAVLSENAPVKNAIPLAISGNKVKAGDEVDVSMDSFSLQTCNIPSTGLHLHLRQYGFNNATPIEYSNENENSNSAKMLSSPVCTALDAYLDNIIGNVPQLALCLQEKGFVQSVRLLRTEDIPCLSSSDLEGSSKSGVMRSCSAKGTIDDTSQGREPLFSPSLVESDAAMLLQFLKANCNRENSTYLLRRNAGDTYIQLYDITSLSGQRQRKWIWWLAMMSYRFALRLDQLSKTVAPVGNEAMKRNFRDRQRSLLHNSLELIQDLADMDGRNHETISAAISELLADTYLWNGSVEIEEEEKRKVPVQTKFSSSSSCSSPSTSSHPYNNVNADGLTKAQDNLMNGISVLVPALERAERRSISLKRQQEAKRKPRVRVTAVLDDSSSDDEISNDSDSNETSGQSIEMQAIAMQMYGLHHKLINVSLRLAMVHLRNYWSSSAMQSLRIAGRRIADASNFFQKLDESDVSPEAFIRSISSQYAWVWECCGNFARSFAADEMWRERGHTCGDDVISLLQDVEVASSHVRYDVLAKLYSNEKSEGFRTKKGNKYSSITEKTKGTVNLNHLSGIIPLTENGEIDCSQTPKPALDMAISILENQKQMQREKRCVLVAAAICYSNAIDGINVIEKHSSDSSLLLILQQRFGDACNEIGKILMTSVKDMIKSGVCGQIAPFLLSSEFWFLEGLLSFEKSNDFKNISLLRCNLCQCCKIRANTNLDLPRKLLVDHGENLENEDSHVELCLQDASKHLELAHEALGQRELHPETWDMVSEELAATFLILGVRRRQSLIGGGSSPVVMQAFRLNPGRERSIIEPMERAKLIYESLKNLHQAAAADYQMALFYSKVWIYQRDGVKTREKISAAFSHFSSAHHFFFTHMRSNEATFIILSLDLSNLYSAVSGGLELECLQKALLCCVDTCDAFSPNTLKEMKLRQPETRHNGIFENDEIQKMKTLAKTVETRIFKLLPNLVKVEKESRDQSSDKNFSTKFEDLYKAILTIKMASTKKQILDVDNVFPIYNLLLKLREVSK